MEESLNCLAGTPELEQLPGRDLFAVASYLEPTDAWLARGCLVASGIPAVVADDNLTQTYSLLAVALGGVRVLVPENYLLPAQQVLEAFRRGEFTLGDDADVGDPE